MTFQPTTVKLPWAELCFSDPWFIKHGHEYEKELWKHVTCPEGGVAIDIGAHQGFYTTKLAKEAGESGFIIAVEPEKQNFELLQRNLRMNDLIKGTLLVNWALSDYEGTGRMFTYAADKTSGKHFLRGSSENEAMYYEYKSGKATPTWFHATETEVQVTTLDTLSWQFRFREKHKRLDLIKMDAEGAEIRILNGGKTTLEEFHPKLVIEVHYGMLDDLMELLLPLGYILVESGGMSWSSNPYAIFEVA